MSKTWIEGKNGNRASVENWGSEEAARASLETLKGCTGCSDCSHCSGKKGDEPPMAVFEIAVPKIENINQRIYEVASAEGVLDMREPHKCGTTHCRAGWAVHLAGEAGYALERRFNWELAAMLIYRKSGSSISPVKFYDGNEAALADMKRCAELEAQAAS